MGLLAVVAELPRSPVQPPGAKWKSALAFSCLLSLLVPAAPLLATEQSFTLNDYARYYEAVLAWLVAMAIVPARISAESPQRWRFVAMTCGVIGVVLWLAGAWTHNMREVFYLGMGAAFALLIICKLWFRLPAAAILTVNTLLLLILTLGLADLFTPRPPRLDPHVAMARKYYSYENARKDPFGFACWWNYYVEQWQRMLKDIVARPRANPQLPFAARFPQPGFECPIEVNHLGFRGREIAREKGNTYRIVALGESTTFGHTLGADRTGPGPSCSKR